MIDSQTCTGDDACHSRICQDTCCATDYFGCTKCASAATQTDCVLPTVTAVASTPANLPPAGGAATITITGTNFAPASSGSSNVYALSFGKNGDDNAISDASTGCVVNSPTTITCTSVTIPAGQGKLLTVKVMVGRDAVNTGGHRTATSAASASSSLRYAAGTITSVTYTSPSTGFSTMGLSSFTLVGSGFGSAAGGSVVQAVGLGDSGFGFATPATAVPFALTAGTCTVTSDTAISCTSVVMNGQGRYLELAVHLGPHAANTVVTRFTSTPGSVGALYEAPVISSLSGSLACTAASSTFTVTGTNFGPANADNSNNAVQEVQAAGDTFAVTTASSVCAVTVADTTIVCTNAVFPGAGRNIPMTIALGINSGTSAWSAYSTATLDYPAPTITGLAANGGTVLNTASTNTLDIDGTCIRAVGMAGDAAFLTRFALGDGAAGRLQFPYHISAGSCAPKGGSATAILCTNVVVNGAGQALQAYAAAGVEAPWNVLDDAVQATLQSWSTAASGSGVTLSYQAPTCTVADPFTGTAPRDPNGSNGIQITGAHFGTAAASPVDVRQIYDIPAGGGTLVHSAVGCVTDSDTQLHCTTSVGGGAGVYYMAYVGPSAATQQIATCTAGATSLTMLPSYPTLFAAEPAGSPITTEGGSRISLTGTQFGPTDSIVTAIFGIPNSYNKLAGAAPYAATSCIVLTADTKIECRMPQGFGAGHVWKITRNGHTSTTPGSPTTVEYTPPVITAVDTVTGSALALAGGDQVVLQGFNFGQSGLVPVGVPTPPSPAAQIVVTYGPAGSSTLYTATNCVVTVSHTRVVCATMAGVGSNLIWQMRINTQLWDGTTTTVSSGTVGGPLTSKVSYAAPTVSAVSVAGNGDVTITGSGFSPTRRRALQAEATTGERRLVVSVQVFLGPASNPQQYEITGCTVTSTTVMFCPAAGVPAGAGMGFSFSVVIGGSASPAIVLPSNVNMFVLTNPTISAYPAALGPTSGGTVVAFAGSFTVASPAIGVTATYTASQAGTLAATSCSIVSASTVQCTTAAGTGTGFTWSLSFDGYVVNGGGSSVYSQSTVTAVSGGSALPLAGGSIVTLTGTNFGPLGTTISAVYGSYTATTCFVSVAHTTVQCTSVAGSGSAAGYRWTVTTNGLAGVLSTSSVMVRYAVPVVSGQLGGDMLNTAGGTVVHLTGMNFGSGSPAPTATYGASSGTEFTASSCTVVSDAQLDCTTVAGTGAGHKWIVTLDGLVSTTTPPLTSYGAPTITSIAPATLSILGSAGGGGSVVVLGTNFGGTSSGITMQFGTVDTLGTGAAQTATCTNDGTTPNTKLSCTYPVYPAGGTGPNLHWLATVNGVTGTHSSVFTSYATPVVSSLALTVVNGNALSTLSTDGGETVTVTGTGFANSGLGVTYGPVGATTTYTPSCTYVSGTSITCVTVAGTGTLHLWVVTVAGQMSPSFSGTSYAQPTISNVVPSGARSTEGGWTVAISGSGFAAAATATYGPHGSTNRYTASCGSSNSFSTVTCTAAAGVGAGHHWVVTVANVLVSAASSQMTSYAAPTTSSLSAAAAAMNTLGGEMIVISGSNFGPLNTPVSATYGSSYVATGCTTTQVAPSQISCTTVPGVGTTLGWTVTVDGQVQSNGVLNSAYSPPAITGVFTSGLMPTQGGTSAVLQGTNFGPIGVAFTATYGTTAGAVTHYGPVTCSVISPSTAAQCIVDSGNGQGMFWEVTVGGQTSTPFLSGAAYTAPVILAITAPALNTLGGEAVRLRGVNFGPVADGASGVTATYQAPGEAVYAATACTTTTADTVITCMSAAGFGSGHRWTVVVNGVSSDASTATTAYGAPTVASVVVGSAGSSMATAGGEALTIMGGNFGPTTTAVSVSYGPSMLYGATYWKYTDASCTVAIASTKITCTSLAGSGGNLKWQVTVGSSGAVNAPAFAGPGYTVPAVTAISSAPAAGFSPNGGNSVTLTGTNFGASSTGTDFFGNDVNILGVSYSNGASSLTPTGCSTISHSTITCTTVAGTGSGYAWTVTVNRQVSPASAAFFAYRGVPSITVVTFVNFLGTTVATMRPAGGDTVTLTGTLMGLTSDSVSVTYSRDGWATWKSATGCTVVSATSVTCTTAAGVGTGYAWKVTVAGQVSSASTATSAYWVPAITSLTVYDRTSSNVVSFMRVVGGDTVVISGTNLGYVGDAVTAWYRDGGAVKTYTASMCYVMQPVAGSSIINCTTVSGMNLNSLSWLVTVEGSLNSAPSTATTLYLPPASVGVVTVLDTTAAHNDITSLGARTAGGDFVGFMGGASSNYGFTSDSFAAQCTNNGVWTWSSQCSQINPSSGVLVIACVIPPGFGTNFQWKLYVNGQESQPFGGTINYRPPVISDVLTGAPVGTSGYTNVVITGTDFGPMVEGNVITASYGPQSDVTRYVAVGCSIVVAHTSVKCAMAVGTGAGDKWVITIGTQQSVYSTVTTSYGAPFISSLSTVMPLVFENLNTAGGEYVYLVGVNFGDVGSVAAAHYGPRHYVASCVCTVAFVKLRCTTTPGYGSTHFWRVTVDGQTSIETEFPWSTSYNVPAVSGVAVANYGITTSTLSTAGGDGIVLTGTNFGPSGGAAGPLVVTYVAASGASYTAAGCAVTTSDTVVACSTVAGVGSGFNWVVSVAGQASAQSSAATSYAPPEITSVTSSAVTQLLAVGGEAVTIVGRNFGDLGSAVVSATYSNADGYAYAAATCSVTTADFVMVCTTSVGIGMQHAWIVKVAGQASSPSTSMTSYAPPVITALQMHPMPAYASGLNTAGGDKFDIFGHNFGPVGTPINAICQSTAHGALTPSACTVMADSRVSCTSVAGTGAGWTVTVMVGSQVSVPSAAKLAYGAPIITGVNTGVDNIGAVKVGGNTVVTLTGVDFGPVSAVTNPIVGTYGPMGVETTAINCAVVVANVEIQCTTVPSSGLNHKWQVVVDAQRSNSSITGMSFAKDNGGVIAAAIAVPGGLLLMAAIFACVCRGRRSAVVRCLSCGACGNGKTELPRSLHTTSV